MESLNPKTLTITCYITNIKRYVEKDETKNILSYQSFPLLVQLGYDAVGNPCPDITWYHVNVERKHARLKMLGLYIYTLIIGHTFLQNIKYTEWNNIAKRIAKLRNKVWLSDQKGNNNKQKAT